MPVNKPELQPSKKIFTKENFEEGECTKDGLPLGSQPIDEKPLAPADVAPPDKPQTEGPADETQSEPQATGKEQPKEADGNVSDGGGPKQDGGE